MPDWNPDLYRRFEDERTRPAADLLARVGSTEVSFAVDIGCGPGNSTALVAARSPEAALLGIDTSEAMLASARERLPQARFERDDAATWTPFRPPDLIFANASLQWVHDHATLFPRLFSFLAPGGTLAVQMPDNFDEPSHRAMRDMAAAGPWRDRIGDAEAARAAVLAPGAYYDLLCRAAATLDIWRTTYQHPIASPAEIVTWFRSTGLRPYLQRLEAADAHAFLQAYEAAIDEAYPPRADGRRLLSFPRLFIVARRGPA